jgi:transcription elongation factor Elf1
MYVQTATFHCAYCNSENVIEVDLSAGITQDLIEDCQICCRPNALQLRFDEKGTSVQLEALAEFE